MILPREGLSTCTLIRSNSSSISGRCVSKGSGWRRAERHFYAADNIWFRSGVLFNLNERSCRKVNFPYRILALAFKPEAISCMRFFILRQLLLLSLTWISIFITFNPGPSSCPGPGPRSWSQPRPQPTPQGSGGLQCLCLGGLFLLLHLTGLFRRLFILQVLLGRGQHQLDAV